MYLLCGLVICFGSAMRVSLDISGNYFAHFYGFRYLQSAIICFVLPLFNFLHTRYFQWLHCNLSNGICCCKSLLFMMATPSLLLLCFTLRCLLTTCFARPFELFRRMRLAAAFLELLFCVWRWLALICAVAIVAGPRRANAEIAVAFIIYLRDYLLLYVWSLICKFSSVPDRNE